MGYKNIGHLKYYWKNEQINQWIIERKLILMINTIRGIINPYQYCGTYTDRPWKAVTSLTITACMKMAIAIAPDGNSPLPGGQRWEGLGLLSHPFIGTSRGSEWEGGRTKYPVHRIQVTFSHWNKNIMWSGWECDWHSNFYVLRDKKSQLQTTDQSLVNRTNVIGLMTMNKNTYLTLNIYNFNSVWRSILIHRCTIKGPLWGQVI